MAKFFNRAKMTTATTGTGTVTLGSASVGFQTFADAGVADSDVVQYVIEEGSNFEIGTGTYTSSGTTLTRTPTESSESDNSAITLSGTATVAVTAIDDDYNRLQHGGSDKVVATSTGATVTGTLTATSFSGDGSALTGIEGVPTGVIAMWSGTNANIPSGWALCDGTNSTPDLTDRFILGRASGANTNSTGGANTVTLSTGNLPAHTHGIGNIATTSAGAHTHTLSGNTGAGGDHSHNGTTSNIGNHTHTMLAETNGGSNNANIGNHIDSKQTNAVKNLSGSAAGSHSHNLSIGNSGNHTHTLSGNAASAGAHTHTISGDTGSVGSGTAVTITPVYYTLAFIIKT
jgi:microcystin-dependent protein